MVLFNTDDSNKIQVYGHLFTPNETATFVGILDQVQAELELVVTNLENNNVSLAQNHAIKAASLLTPKIMIEITEDNPRLTSDLRSAVNHLQNLSSPSESQLKSVSQLVNGLNKRLGEDAIVRLAQLQPTSSNFLEGALKSLGSMFGSSNTNEEQDQNTKLQALAFANVIDGALINYGKAYRVGFDMTNMSNMAMMGNNGSNSPGSMIMSNTVTGNNSSTSNMSMPLMNTSSSNTTAMAMLNHGDGTNTEYSLANFSDYQSAQGLAKKALEIFNTKLKNSIPSDNKNATIFVRNLEKGLIKLNDSIGNEASPLDVMMIVHTQVHPNLLEAYNLQLRKQ